MGYIKDMRKYIGHGTLIIPCACLIIGDGNGNILLQQRADDGKWGNHGGAVEIDEKVEDALSREVYEELGIKLEEPLPFGIYSGAKYHHIYPNGDEISPIDIVFICHKYSGELSFTDGEVKSVKWFNAENLPENISDNSKEAIRDYFKKYFDTDVKI